MRHNLFAALWKRRPREDRDPEEDFVTEAFAWILAHEPGLGDAFAAWLAQRGGWTEPGSCFEWTTQHHLSAGGERGFIDLLGRGLGQTLLIENKLWAPLHHGQLPNYRVLGQSLHGEAHKVVLITATRAQHTQPADLSLVWGEVCAWLDGRAKAESGAPLLTAQFVEFMMDKGLGPIPRIEPTAIAGYLPGLRLVPALTAVFEDLERNGDPACVAQAHAALGAEPGAPHRLGVVKGLGWGRLGLQLPGWRRWRPGLFVGVMLDPTDHRVQLSDPSRGPDFCAIVDVHLHGDGPTHAEQVQHERFTALRERLRREVQPPCPYRFVDHLADPAPNLWHPIHLQRPLADLFPATLDPAEQRATLERHIQEVLDILLRGGEIAAMVEAFRRLT